MTFTQRLELSSARLGELKGHTATSQSPVDLGVGIQSVVDATTLLLVQNNLQCLAAVLLGAKSLANNLNRVHEIGEDSIVDGGECSGAGSLLLLRVARSSRPLGAGENSSRGKDQDMSV